jgi:hypothetical protein
MFTKSPISLGVVARKFGLPVWKIRRLFERQLLPEPGRIGLYRVVTTDDLPVIEAALRAAGYLPRRATSHA